MIEINLQLDYFDEKQTYQCSGVVEINEKTISLYFVLTIFANVKFPDLESS